MKNRVIIGIKIISQIKLTVANHDWGAHFFLSCIYRSAVWNGLAGRRNLILRLNAYSLVRKLYLLKRASINVDDLRIVMHLDEMEDQVESNDVSDDHILPSQS